MSVPFLLPTYPLPSFSLPFILFPRQIAKAFIRCGLFTVMCTIGLHLSRSIRMMRLKIEVSYTTVKACYSVPSAYVEG